jgi:hypothetical protein
VLVLAGVELAARPVGLELGALDREPLAGEPLVVLALDLLDRLRRGPHAGRRDRVQKRLHDRLLEPQAADRLAGAIGAVQVVGAHAGIARHAAVGARIGDLHPPAAGAAADDALQQRPALAGGAAGLAAADHVGPQPLARGQNSRSRTHSPDGARGCRRPTARAAAPPSGA